MNYAQRNLIEKDCPRFVRRRDRQHSSEIAPDLVSRSRTDVASKMTREGGGSASCRGGAAVLSLYDALQKVRAWAVVEDDLF